MGDDMHAIPAFILHLLSKYQPVIHSLSLSQSLVDEAGPACCLSHRGDYQFGGRGAFDSSKNATKDRRSCKIIIMLHIRFSTSFYTLNCG